MSTNLSRTVRPLAGALAVAVMLLFPGAGARGAGFEKATTWSGRYAGMASAALATVAGPESLYFNPAGLAGRQGAELSLNLSPTVAQLDGGLPGAPGRQIWANGDPKTAPVASTLAAYGLSDRWGIGLGFYVSGGMKAFFEEVDYTSIFPQARLRPTVKADLELTEVGIGTAYQLAPGLKIGGSCRVVNVKADFSSARLVTQGGMPVALQNIHFTGLEDTNYGFRAGVQYEAPDARWGLGASWRSRVRFNVEGDTSGQLDSIAAPAVASLGSGRAALRNSFPQQIAIGGFYRESHNLLFVGEVAWTEYSDNSVLDVTGNLGSLSLDQAGDIIQNWGNMTNVRFGVEYTGLGRWALRAGYIFTSRVTPSDYARATFSAPGEGHTITFGVGRQWSSKLEWNLAAEYSFADGYGWNATDGVTNTSFQSHALVAHTGVSYRF